MTDKDLRRSLTELHETLRKEIKSVWDRSVSFQDELFDRWERADFMGFGKGTSVYQDSLIIGDVSVGADTWIGPFTVLDGSGGLTIGDNCSISAGVQIYTHDTVQRRMTGGEASPERAPTRIGDWCYIGPLSIVTKGVSIGDNAVVGAHSLVNADVSPGTVVFGAPARTAGKVAVAADGSAVVGWTEAGDDPSVEELRARIDVLEVRVAEMERRGLSSGGGIGRG